MYHHRRQPHTSHLANRNRNAFGSLNHQQNSQSVNQSTTAPPRLNINQGPEVGHLKTSYNREIAPSGSHQPKYYSNNTFGNQNRLGTNAAYHSGAYSSQPKQFAEERQDVIFRRVRGILNKITPETFDKLSRELINVGLDSPRTLRGLIYLLFDKALKDLKYSSLYAKLCQQLSEKAPNFETEPGPNTFCKFLISKCEDEFERRRKATEDFDGKNALTDEEFEQKAIAKQKMLGNIKFICELGKKRLLQEEILHECIRGLLSKKKERPIEDQAQDLECLCQIMRTIGSLLDIDASRNLMNQYFERIDMYSRKPELPSRIRFMLRDVIDLRNNKWRPRPFQKEDNVPQPLSRLREEAGFGNASAAVSIDKLGNTKNLPNIGDLSKLHGNRLSSLLLDDDGPSFTTTTDFHWGSNTFMPDEAEFDIFSTAAPIQKIDISQRNSSATSAARMTCTLSANSTYTASVSKHPFTNQSTGISQHNKSTGKYNNNNGMINAPNKSDPCTDPHKVNKFNFNERLPHFKENTIGPRGNQIVNKHPSKIGQDLIRTNHLEEQQMPLLPAKGDLRSKDTNSISLGQDGDLRPGYNNNCLHTNNRSIIRESSLNESSVDARLSAARPMHSTNDERRQAIERSPPLNRQPDLEPIDRSRPSMEVSDRRLEQNALASGPRERRNARFEREPRQPKFCGANYRLPGRDRSLQNQLPREQFLAVRRDQIPESDINLNWRSKPSIEPKSSSKEIDLIAETTRPFENLDRPSRPDARSRERPSADIVTQDAMKRGPQQRNSTSHEIFQDERNESDRFKKPQQPVCANEHSFSASKGSPSIPESKLQPKVPNPYNQSKSDEVRSIELTITGRFYNDLGPPQMNRAPKRFNLQEPDHHSRDGPSQLHNEALPSRPNQHFGDRRDRDRSRQNFAAISVPAEDRRSAPMRTREDPRPNHNRNSQVELNRSPDRVRDWRKDAPANLLKREPAVSSLALPSPLLPKPPTRMSQTDFTLRPSHNLIGRSTTDFNKQHINKLDGTKSNSLDQPAETLELQETVVVGTELDQNKNLSPEIKPRDDTILYVEMFDSSIKKIRDGNPSDITKAASKIKELKIPKNFHHECLLNLMKQSIIGSALDGEIASKLLVSLVPNIFETATLSSAFKLIFEQMHALEVETPKVKSLVAEFLSRSVVDGLLALEDVAALLSGGKHHPLFLLLLQKLEKSCGQAWLSEKFTASKVNLMEMLPEVDRSKERLATALKDRCLGFLDPILTIEPDLWQQMSQTDPSPAAVYRWIKDNVDQTILVSPTFAHVFVACLLKYVNSETAEKFKTTTNQSDSDDSNKSSPSNSVSQAMNEYEKELLSKYQQVLQALLENKPMQLATLYAVQSFYHGLDFPKGALLRWFHNLYDMSVVDDDVFFIWKEEINNQFPGKGQALFQVNTWLNWLAEAESEEEEDV